MQYLALFDQVLEDSSDFFDGHCRVHTVLVIQVNVIGPQALERFLDHLTDMCRTAVQSCSAVDREAELRCNLYLVPKRCERFTDEFLAGVRTIYLGGIEEYAVRIVLSA